MGYYVCKIIKQDPTKLGLWADNNKQLSIIAKEHNFKLVESKEIIFPDTFKNLEEAQEFVDSYELNLSQNGDSFEIKDVSLGLAEYHYIGNNKSKTNKREGHYKCHFNRITNFRQTLIVKK